MRAWTFQIVQQYEGWFETADDALAEIQRLGERQESGLTLVREEGRCWPQTDKPPNEETA